MRTSELVRETWTNYFDEKERTAKLLNDLAEENVELKRTVEKLQMSKGGSKELTKQFLSLKKQFAAKSQECEHLQSELNKATVQLQVFEVVGSQLDRLQTLQNELILENQKLKQDRFELTVALGNVKELVTATKPQPDSLSKIGQIIRDLEKKVPKLQIE